MGVENINGGTLLQGYEKNNTKDFFYIPPNLYNDVDYSEVTLLNLIQFCII